MQASTRRSQTILTMRGDCQRKHDTAEKTTQGSDTCRSQADLYKASIWLDAQASMIYQTEWKNNGEWVMDNSGGG